MNLEQYDSQYDIEDEQSTKNNALVNFINIVVILFRTWNGF